MKQEQKVEGLSQKTKELIKLIAPTILIFLIISFYYASNIYFGSGVVIIDHERSDTIVLAMIVSVVVASFILSRPDKFSYFMVRFLAVSLFFLTFFCVCFSMLFYESLPFQDATRLREAQIFLAVSSAGMMGGLMRYFSHDGVIKNDALDLWHMIHAAIVGLFVSLVLFLILRAGIINQTQVDTFNVWGVTGVSAITGFFAERVIEKFSSLYNEVVGTTNKPSTEN